MPYLDRIIVYLKGPDLSDPDPDKRIPALIDAQRFINSPDPASEALFLKSPTLRKVTANKEIAFELATTQGICDTYGLMVAWPRGCRVILNTILGEKGDNLGTTLGVEYKDTGTATACDTIYCRFNSAGVFTFEDRQGITVTMDTCKPALSALCVTLVPRTGSRGVARFPGGEFELPEI